MKNFILYLAGLLLLCTHTNAQSPQSIPYQAVVRDSFGTPKPNQNMSLRLSVRDGSSSGTVVYKETQSVTTDKLGMFTANVGAGTVVTGTFGSINWNNGTKYLQTEIDLTGGSSYTDMGTSQMRSVPFALYSLSSGNADIAPVKQITYGSATGLTSDANFTRDPITGNTNIKVLHGINYYSLSLGDSNNIDPCVGVLNIPSVVIGYGDTLGHYTMNMGVGQIPSYGVNEFGFMNLSDSLGNTAAIDFVGDVNDKSPQILITANNASAPHNGGRIQVRAEDTEIMWQDGDGLHAHGFVIDSNNLQIFSSENDYRWLWPNSEGSSGQPLVTDGNGTLSFAPISGNASAMGAHSIYAGNASSTDTITVVSNKNNIYTNMVPGVSLLVQLPASPNDGDIFMLTFGQSASAITYTNGTVGSSVLFSAGSGAQKVYTYDTASSTWY